MVITGPAALPAWTAENDQANSRFGQCVAGVTGVAKVDNQLDVKTN